MPGSEGEQGVKQHKGAVVHALVVNHNGDISFVDSLLEFRAQLVEAVTDACFFSGVQIHIDLEVGHDVSKIRSRSCAPGEGGKAQRGEGQRRIAAAAVPGGGEEWLEPRAQQALQPNLAGSDFPLQCHLIPGRAEFLFFSARLEISVASAMLVPAPERVCGVCLSFDLLPAAGSKPAGHYRQAEWHGLLLEDADEAGKVGGRYSNVIRPEEEPDRNGVIGPVNTPCDRLAEQLFEVGR